MEGSSQWSNQDSQHSSEAIKVAEMHTQCKIWMYCFHTTCQLGYNCLMNKYINPYFALIVNYKKSPSSYKWWGGLSGWMYLIANQWNYPDEYQLPGQWMCLSTLEKVHPDFLWMGQREIWSLLQRKSKNRQHIRRDTSQRRILRITVPSSCNPKHSAGCQTCSTLVLHCLCSLVSELL